MKRFSQICIITVLACVVMGIIDAVIQPGYVIKSAIKILLFLLLPVLYAWFNKDDSIKSLFIPGKKGLFLSLGVGIGVYVVVLGAYLLLKDTFDFSALTASLNESTGVNKNNFIFVALYISFINSLLEEFFFRGFAFIALKQYTTRKFAYIFSALIFALYHVAIMIGWFGLPVIFLSLAGLFIGGIIFNRFDEKQENIYLSWLIHMFANFATNTIGFMLFAG